MRKAARTPRQPKKKQQEKSMRGAKGDRVRRRKARPGITTIQSQH
jgi:hypothetical protein